MSSEIVFTLTGPDRVGIVEEVTRALLDLGGNVETSRMMRLGGEFAMLMLVTVPEAAVASLDASVTHLTDAGYKVTTSLTAEPAGVHAGWPAYRVEVVGADHKGIINEIARGLSSKGINIESAETETSHAPATGAPLFSMTARVVVPPGLSEPEWQADLAEAAGRANVDVTVTAE